MSASPDIVSNLETRLVALAAELLLAKPDSDGALVSIYGLIAEMEGDVVSAPALSRIVRGNTPRAVPHPVPNLRGSGRWRCESFTTPCRRWAGGHR